MAADIGDFAILSDARDRLAATGAFDEVLLNRPLRGPVGEDQTAVACVVHSGWNDMDVANDLSLTDQSYVINHEGTFIVEIAINEDDDELRFTIIEGLVEQAKDALGGQSLAGLTAPARTIVRSGTYDRAYGPPDMKVTLTVEFLREIGGFQGY